MTYVLVLRDTDAKVSKIWQGKKLDQVLRKVRTFAAHRRRHKWPMEADDYIKANYNTTSASDIANKLTKQLGRRVTKNSVIGRYHRVKDGTGLQVEQTLHGPGSACGSVEQG